MLKKVIMPSAAAAVLLLTGCGGGGGSSASATGTGTYIDSPVAGVDYECGSQIGTTDSNGVFHYEKGKSCTFKVAGVTLRTVSKEILSDNEAKIVETEDTVSHFLMSLDVDGDLSNGIQIEKSVKEVLKEKGIKEVPKDESSLEEVVTFIKQKVKSFKGHVPTPQEMAEHLRETEKSILKKYAGKSLYEVDFDEEGPEIWKITFAEDLTSVVSGLLSKDGSVEEEETYSIKADPENPGYFLFENDEEKIHWKLIAVTENYFLIEVFEYENGTKEVYRARVFWDKAKAEEWANQKTAAESGIAGIGRYVDSPVEGIDYVCGSKTGTTDKEGTFRYDKNKACTFKVANITVRTLPAQALTDNEVEIIESFPAQTRFLQSLDSDGDPSNGIQITQAVKEALKTCTITSIPTPKDYEESAFTNTLENIVNKIKDTVTDFKGQAVSEYDAIKYALYTEENVLKKYAGRPIYEVENEDGNPEIWELTFSSDMKTLTAKLLDASGKVTETDTYSLDIDPYNKGYIGLFSSADNEYIDFRILKVAQDYFEVEILENVGSSNPDRTFAKVFEDKNKAISYAQTLR